MPASLLLVRRIRHADMRVMRQRDVRGNLLSELLAGFRVIKLCAWEDWVWRRTTAARLEETRWLRQQLFLSAYNTLLMLAGPVLVSVGTLGLYAASKRPPPRRCAPSPSCSPPASPEPMTAATAFTALAWFGLLRAPLSLIPYVLATAAASHVSLRRLARFMTRESAAMLASSAEEGEADEEEEAAAAPSVAAAEPAAEPAARDSASAAPAASDAITLQCVHVVSRCSDPRAWWSPRPGALPLPAHAVGEALVRDLSLRVPRGALVLLVGAVGAGKSSLLRALAGGLPWARSRAGAYRRRRYRALVR